MRWDSDRRRGNGMLYALGGLGVLLIAAGVSIEKLGDLHIGDALESRSQRGFDPNDAVADAPEAQGAPEAPPMEPQPTPADTEAALLDALAEPEAVVRLLWLAETETGSSPPGTSCVIGVDVARYPNGASEPTHVRVECDGMVRYESPASAHFEAVAESGGRFAYRASVDSAITGASIRVRTGEHMAVLRDATGVTTLYVEDLSIPHASDVPLVVDGYVEPGPVTERLRLLAVPRESFGSIPPAVALAARIGRPQLGVPASTCELTGTAVPGRYSCRVTLRCGTDVVYGRGTTGYNDCTASDGAIVYAEDTGTTVENQDPRITLDVARRRLEVSDDDGTSTWSATFDLVEDERCALAGRWTGGGHDVDGAAFTWAMDAVGGSTPWTARITWNGDAYEGLEETVEVTPDCASGRMTMTTRAVSDPRLGTGTYALWLGPSFRSFAGHWQGDGVVPGSMWGWRN